MNYELYINGKLIELDKEVSIPITYQIEDIMNPGAIKTDWSKTISIPSTHNNDNALDHLYKIDRTLNVNFNILNKIPFELRHNNELFKSGYIKIGNITNTDGVIRYELTLYSELSELFYKLSQVKLKDLNYRLLGNSKLKHNINRDFIKANWASSVSGIHEYLVYIPTFQGNYNNFDSSKWLAINSDPTIPPLDLSYDVDEWSIKAFSSYRQKPGIYFKKILEGIIDAMPDYTFNLSPLFFNSDNPYYDKTIITLNNYNDIPLEKAFVTSEFERDISYLDINYDNTQQTPTMNYVNILDDELLLSDGAGKHKFAANFENYTAQVTTKIIGTVNMYANSMDTVVRYVLVDSGSFGAYFKTAAAFTDCNIIFDFATNNYRVKIPANTRWGVLQTLVGGVWIDNVNVTKVGTAYINVIDIANYPAWVKSLNVFGDGSLTPATLYNAEYADGTPTYDVSFATISFGFNTSGDSFISMKYVLNMALTLSEVIKSNTIVGSPYLFEKSLTSKDFLIEFCKLFGLVFIVDEDKTVNILTKNEYFVNDIKDITSYADLSKEVNINPLLFDKSRILIGFKEDTSSNFLKEYKNVIGFNYGDKVVNTNYQFNNDSVRILNKTIFTPTVKVNQKIYKPETTIISDELVNISYFDIQDKNTRKNVKDAMGLVFKNENILLSGAVMPGHTYNKYVIFDDTYQMEDNNVYYYNLNIGNRCIEGNTTIPTYDVQYFSDKSLEFIKPDMTWYSVSNTFYPESKTLYYKFWKAWIEDRYNADTKSMTLYLNLKPSDFKNFSLRNFYFYGGVYWVINKIVDYDITNDSPTKIEFISINNIIAYTNGQIY